jgi:hypothetical protein
MVAADLLPNLRELTICQTDLSLLTLHGPLSLKCEFCEWIGGLTVLSQSIPKQVAACSTLRNLLNIQMLDLSSALISDWSRVLLLSQLPW